MNKERTEPYYVYVISCDAGPVKIGLAKNPTNRLRLLQAASPFNLKWEKAYECEKDEVTDIEWWAHNALTEFRLRGEWFNVSVGSAIKAVEAAFEKVRNGADRPVVAHPRQPLPREECLRRARAAALKAGTGGRKAKYTPDQERLIHADYIGTELKTVQAVCDKWGVSVAWLHGRFGGREDARKDAAKK